MCIRSFAIHEKEKGRSHKGREEWSRPHEIHGETKKEGRGGREQEEEERKGKETQDEKGGGGGSLELHRFLNLFDHVRGLAEGIAKGRKRGEGMQWRPFQNLSD